MKILETIVFLLALQGCGSIPFSSQSHTRTIDIQSYEDNAFKIQPAVSNKISLNDNPTLDDYILYAYKKSSPLKASYLQYESALLKAPQVSSLPDPILSYGYFIQEIETRVGSQQQKVGVMQPIPWFGKLSLKEAIANEEAKAAFYSFITKKNELAARISKNYYELAYLLRAKELTAANLELLKRWEKILTQRYKNQLGTQSDLIKAQVELGKLEDKLQELSQFEEPTTARLNSFLNRKSSEPVIIQDNALANVSKSSISVTDFSQAALVNKLSSSPELLLLDSLIKAKDSGVKLAHKNFYPDLGIGADYIFIGDRGSAGSESGDDAIVGVFSMTLPIYRSKYKARLNQAEKENKAVNEMRKAKFHDLSGKVAQINFEIRDSRRRITLYKDTLVPKARESLESTYAAFESGKATFLELLDTERSVLDLQLSLARARADLYISEAQLRATLGDFSKDQSNRIANNGEK